MSELTTEQMSLLNKFKRCVDTRTIEKMDKKLYSFFMYDCGFIAHYNLHGFRDEYSGQDFIRWFEVFTDPNWMFFNQNGNHENLKRVCVEYAKEHKAAVLSDFERMERNRKLRLLHALSADLGMESTNKKETTPSVPDILLQEDKNGQLVLFA